MKKLMPLILTIFLGVVGCSSSTQLASHKMDAPNKERYPERKSLAWCQKNYSSASVSMRDRKTSALHCDTAAREAYYDAKKAQEEKKD